MIEVVLLANLGVSPPDMNGISHTTMYDKAANLTWIVVIQVEIGGPLTGSIIRLDPGTMGRTLFHFRTTPRDGRHGLNYISFGDTMSTAPLPAVCAFMRSVWVEVAAERVPEVQALALQHLDLTLPIPPIEIRPGDRSFLIELFVPE